MEAARRWEAALAGWGLPAEILAAAPVDPWSFAPGDLPAGGDDERTAAPSPADEVALDALPRGGSVLDVGCGPGGSSWHLRGRAGRCTGVDRRADALVEYERTVTTPVVGLRSVLTRTPAVVTVPGRWPAVADRVGPHDVVVCHNTLYDVGEDVAGFVAALTDHARVAVVLAITDRHPLSWLTPYVEQLHGLGRPSEPSAATAADIVREVTGRRPATRRWSVDRARDVEDERLVRLVARRCAVGEDRFGDVRTALRRVPPAATISFVALSWPGTA